MNECLFTIIKVHTGKCYMLNCFGRKTKETYCSPTAAFVELEFQQLCSLTVALLEYVYFGISIAF